LSATAPAGAPALQSVRRRPAAIGSGPLTGIAYVSLTASSSVTFGSAPSFTFVAPIGSAFKVYTYIAVYDAANPGNGWTTIEGPGAQSGSSITFSATQGTTTFGAGTTFVFALFNTSQPLPTPTPTPTPAPANVTFSVTVPAATSSRHRRPAYVSPSTQSVRLALEPNGPSAVASCQAACQISLQAPSGTQTFSVVLYDGAGASGNVLSRGSTRVTVAPGTTTALAVTLGGVPHRLSLSLPASLPAGTAATVPISLLAYDAQDRLIIGSDPYVDSSGNPITFGLTRVDTTAHGSGAMTLSTGTVQTPSDQPSLAYNGAAMTSTTVTATPSLASVPAATSTMNVVTAIAKVIPVGRNVDQLTFGGDGYLWYTGQFAPVIGRVSTTAGTYSEFPLVPFADMVAGTNQMPINIVTARDGSVWFNFETYPSTSNPNDSGIGTISTNGSITLYREPYYSNEFPAGLTAAPDGTIWFGEANSVQISRITTAGTYTSFPLPPNGGGYNWIDALTAGPDGNIWAGGGFFIQRFALDGTGTMFPTPYAHGDNNVYIPDSLAPGSDGNVWYTENTQNGGPRQSKLAKITPAGAITEFVVPAPHNAQFITAGRDGNMWFADNGKVGSIAPSGTVTYYDLGTSVGYFSGMTVSPDGNFWLTATVLGGGSAVVEVVY
jgi:virginiamycin B lyase